MTSQVKLETAGGVRRLGAVRRLTAACCGSALFSTLATNAGLQFAGVATGVITARSLGVQGRGELAQTMLWPIILAAAGGLGVAQSMVYHAARGQRPVSLLLYQCYLLALIQSAVLMGAGYFLIPLCPAGASPELVRSARLFLWLIPLNLVAQPSLAASQGRMRIRQFNWMRLAVNGAYGVGLAGLYAAGAMSVRAAVWALLAANVVATVSSVAYAIRTFGWEPRVDAGLIRAVLGYGLRIHGGSISPMLNQRLDQMLIALFLTPAQLGLYTVAMTVSTAAEPIASAFALVAFPRAAARASEESPQGLDASMALGLASIAAACACLALAAPHIIGFFFGREFQPAAGPCRLLAAASLFRGCRSLAGAVLNGGNRPGVASRAEVLCLVFSLALLAVLLPRYGIMGAAAASMLANLGALALASHALATTAKRPFEEFHASAH